MKKTIKEAIELRARRLEISEPNNSDLTIAREYYDMGFRSALRYARSLKKEPAEVEKELALKTSQLHDIRQIVRPFPLESLAQATERVLRGIKSTRPLKRLNHNANYIRVYTKPDAASPGGYNCFVLCSAHKAREEDLAKAIIALDAAANILSADIEYAWGKKIVLPPSYLKVLQDAQEMARAAVGANI